MTQDNASSEHTGPGADFGFRRVAEHEKAGLVRGVFDAVAPKYDLMNDLMSGGIHRLWKSAMIDMISPRPGQRIIDVAGGTGDIAFRMLERTGENVPVTVCDINAEMLAVGRDRAIDRGILKGVAWTCGDAEALPFPDASFDVYTIAFGLRNVTHIDKALREARRVLKPGGRYVCLEFSRVVVPGFGKLYDAYSFQILPWLGQMVAGDREAYQYLAESIRKFPDQESLCALMRAEGFGQVTYRNLSGGIAALHSGWRI
ncbi:MAG: bifunctional demethylmenaquinone methyltransferase/2-methoxy-6-polyprenyl-1,4-benzoquinol methylase UbiE [Rhodospirillaceae bacterium]|nr:bifunctional demethylmenaquinone methyltransferase/2-methoxy-6-polyprenyl-1,4-benzoquinol methylase UbiE [Rhodospirillaceae bacterium]